MKVTRRVHLAVEFAQMFAALLFCLWFRFELGQLVPWFESNLWSRILVACIAAIAAGVLAVPLILLRRRYLQIQ